MDNGKRITAMALWLFGLFFSTTTFASEDQAETNPASAIQVSSVAEDMRLEIEQVALSQLETTVNQPQIELQPTGVSEQLTSQSPQVSSTQ